MQLTEPHWYRLFYYSSRTLSDTSELFNDRAGSPGNDLQHKQIPALLIWTKIHVSCRSLGVTLLSREVGVDREIGQMDAATPGIRIHDLASTGYATCRSRFLKQTR